jgi:DNA-binding beta-propeller fold protein YncE
VTTGEIETDPYEGKVAPLTPDLQIGAPGMEPGQLQAPRGIAAAADGSIYVADSRNHRIQHFSPEGELLHVWGSFEDATAANAEAPGGTFNEPWGVAVGPDGSVYVADTWNHRVQKFTAEGQFVTMWGYFGQAENPDAFWGPRDVAVDAQGRVYVTDTGNKRIAVFDANGEFITQFGEAGMDPGQFDEQVGIALGADGLAFITDTWNQRVQVFAAEPGTTNFTPLTTWEVYGWFGQSLDNKPYIAVDSANNVYVTDPEGPRVLKFDLNGKFLAAWGDYAVDAGSGTLYSGVAVDAERGVLWITDANGGRVLRMPLEALPLP